MDDKKGVTLVELAIVIVIIGILITGVLYGDTLIHLAKLAKTEDQITSYKTAYNVFSLKYKCLPGDCAKAVAFGLGTAGGTGDNGNGNNFLDGYNGYQYEYWNFWYHLMKAELIKDNVAGSLAGSNIGSYIPGIGFPSAALSPQTGFFVYSVDPTSLAKYPSGVVMETVRHTGSSSLGNDIGSAADPAMIVTDAAELDKKLDDGMPESGAIRNVLLTSDGFGNDNPEFLDNSMYRINVTSCETTDSPPAYNVSIADYECELIIYLAR